MQLLTQPRIIKALLLVCLFLFSFNPFQVFAESSDHVNSEFADNFVRAQQGEISISELVDTLIEQVIKSPSVGPEVNRYKHLVPSLAKNSAPLLIAKIHKLLLNNKTADAWAVKSLSDVLIPNTWPEGIRIAKIFSVVSSLDTIKEEQNIRALGSIDLSNIGDEDEEVLEKIIKSYANEIVEQASKEPDRFNAIRKLAELSVNFSELPLKEKAGEILKSFSNEPNWQSSKWTFDNPVVQQLVTDLFQDNKEILVKLYIWRTLASLEEGNQNRAAIYYNLLLPHLTEAEKVSFRKEILAKALKIGLNPFVSARIDELKSAKLLTAPEKLALLFKGYFGWWPLLLSAPFVLSIFFVVYKRTPAKKKLTPKTPIAEDEYTRLLKKLNLEEDATEGQIKKAFRLLVKEHHPDAHGAGGVVLDSDGNIDQKFEELRKTYDRVMEIRKSWFNAR